MRGSAETRVFKSVNVRSTTIEVTPESIVVRRPKMVGEDSTTIPMARISAVNVKTGLRSWKAHVTFCGDPDVEVEDMKSGDAKTIRDLVEQYQRPPT